MMQTCWNWMMNLGALGTLLGVVIFVLFVLLLAILARFLVSRAKRLL